MFTIASLLLLIGSSAIALPSPQGYIPTSMPAEVDQAAMHLKVFDSPSTVQSPNPCINQTATLYPSEADVLTPTGSCVTANTINTDSVTCVSRFDDANLMSLDLFTCLLVSYAADGCSGVSQNTTWTAASNSWVLPAEGAKSFKFDCEYKG